jgi:hypothetical protein
MLRRVRMSSLEGKHVLAMEVIDKAKVLVAKLDEIHDSPEFNSLFLLAKVHNQEYSGPTYNAELDELREALGWFE